VPTAPPAGGGPPATASWPFASTASACSAWRTPFSSGRSLPGLGTGAAEGARSAPPPPRESRRQRCDGVRTLDRRQRPGLSYERGVLVRAASLAATRIRRGDHRQCRAQIQSVPPCALLLDDPPECAGGCAAKAPDPPIATFRGHQRERQPRGALLPTPAPMPAGRHPASARSGRGGGQRATGVSLPTPATCRRNWQPAAGEALPARQPVGVPELAGGSPASGSNPNAALCPDLALGGGLLRGMGTQRASARLTPPMAWCVEAR